MNRTNQPPRKELASGRQLMALLLMAVLLVPSVSQASLFGEENGPLTALVAEVAEQISQGAQTIKQLTDEYEQLKATYNETKKYVGMAQDAVNGFNEFRQFGDSVIKNPENALDALFPDERSLRADLVSPQNWARGTGELQRLIRVCLAGGGKCAEFHQAVTAKMASDAISQTFGTAPAGREDLVTIDIEAADAISRSTAATGAAAVTEAQARALRSKCLSGTDSEAIAACQAAGNLAALMQLEQTAVLNQQMAEANRLSALELAQRNGELKRQVRESLERDATLSSAAKGMAPPQVRFRGALETGVEGGGL